MLVMEKKELEYTVKTKELMARYEISPMDLVRIAQIGVGTGYAARENKIISLDTLWRIFKGLRLAGYNIVWNDVVEMP